MNAQRDILDDLPEELPEDFFNRDVADAKREHGQRLQAADAYPFSDLDRAPVA